MPRGTRTRTWSVPTSPRSPFKLADELRLLRDHGFERQPWDHEAQVRFSRLLAKADFFEGNVSESEPDFSARDRINRAPRTFGLVRLPRGAPLQLTKAGNALLEGRAPDDLFLHQLLKWQYPSPNHDDRNYRELFCIRPFLEMLRLIRELQGITKPELALFGVPLIDYQNYENARDSLLAFREEYSRLAGTRVRREFVVLQAGQLFRQYYRDDIATGNIGGREAHGIPPSVTEMIRRKVRNARDYADAAVRYFRATGLFTISSRASRLDILPERRQEVEQILATFERKPLAFGDDEAFYAWLGDPEHPAVPSDEVTTLRQQIRTVYESLDPGVQQEFATDLEARVAQGSAVELKRDYRELVEVATRAAILSQRAALAEQEGRLDEIIELFERIRHADADIVDRPLYFEWNTWRAMVVLDDGAVRNNFSVDQMGEPLNPAPGRMPDIECEYTDACHVLVEVTLTAGATQHASEREPVARHIGLHQARRVELGDARPVFGLFIAPTINPTVVTDFWNLHNARRPAKEFRGYVRVIPLALSTFVAMLDAARGRFPVTAADIERFFAEASQLARTTADELEWMAALDHLARQWLDRRPAAA